MKPNLVMILIDDLGVMDLGCYGSSFYETPTLDRLASQGVRFDQAYASCPVCSPTRASIMSGKYPARVGVTQFIGGNTDGGRLADVPYLHYLPLEEKSIASALRENGYQTWHVGKWHLGDEPFYPEHHGFDVNIGGCHMGWPGLVGHFPPYEVPLVAKHDKEYLADRLTDETIGLIRNRDKSRPFFLNLWHYAVHMPCNAPQELVDKYIAKARALGLDKIDAIEVGEYFPALHLQTQRVERRKIQSDPVYAAMVENLDWNVGRVMAVLEEEGLLANTLIAFTSDNGGESSTGSSPTSNLPYREGKGWNFDGGTRVCQIIRWDGVTQPGSRMNTPVTSTDFYPTFLQAAGLPLDPQQHCDGVSLMPLLQGLDSLDRDAIYWHYPHYSNQGGTPAASMVAGEWKLIEFFEDGHAELYNLKDDLGELRDLAKEFPEKTAELLAKLHAWQQDVAARIPGPNPDWESKRIVPKIPNNAHL